ncbi:MAG: hypothetical protein DRG31_04860, partial [Deltaproteobacteria bacterium]
MVIMGNVAMESRVVTLFAQQGTPVLFLYSKDSWPAITLLCCFSYERDLKKKGLRLPSAMLTWTNLRFLLSYERDPKRLPYCE